MHAELLHASVGIVSLISGIQQPARAEQRPRTAPHMCDSGRRFSPEHVKRNQI